MIAGIVVLAANGVEAVTASDNYDKIELYLLSQKKYIIKIINELTYFDFFCFLTITNTLTFLTGVDNVSSIFSSWLAAVFRLKTIFFKKVKKRAKKKRVLSENNS